MGAFYGSTQVRTADRDRVRGAAEAVATKRGIRCLLGPQIGQWVGVYPQDSGQDETVGEAIAKRVGGVVVHLMLHDDDVFAYWLWSEGRQLDSYWSRPGYFGEEKRHAEEAMAGNPASLADIFAVDAAKLTAVLDRANDELFDPMRLDEFAKLLGIANALMCYEYLKEGDRAGIKGWPSAWASKQGPVSTISGNG
jgi:hypothetical protein